MELDGRGRSISTAILYDVWNALRDLEPGEETAVRTDALPAVDSDLRAWCRTAGHELMGVEERETERRYEIRKTDQPRAQPPWALVISDPGLEELLSAWLRARRGARRQPGRDLFLRPGSTSTDPTIQGEAQGSASRPVQPLRAPRPRPRRPSVPAQEARAAPCAGRPNLRLRALDAALQGRSEQLLFPDIRIAAYPTFVEEMQAAGVQVFLQ